MKAIVEPIKLNGIVKGWRVRMPSGSVLYATMRYEAEHIAKLINEELVYALQQVDLNALKEEESNESR